MRSKRTSEDRTVSDWERPDATSDEIDVRRVCIKKGRDSVECQELLAPYRELSNAQNGYIPSDLSMVKAGRAMRAKRTSEEDRTVSDWERRDAISNASVVRRVCSKKGMDSVECQQ